MKRSTLISLALFLALLAGCAPLTPTALPAPQRLVLAPLPRLSLTTSGQTFNCGGDAYRGATISGSNITLRNCLLTGAAGTGLQVSGTNNTVEDVVIDGVTLANGDADGCRFFGSGHLFKNLTIRNVQVTEPAHTDGCQTWGDSNHVAGNNIVFDTIDCDVYGVWIGSDGVNHKSTCFQIESGSPATNVAHHITVKNSILHAYRTASLGDSGDQGTTNNIYFLNNTIVGTLPRTGTIQEFGIFITKAVNVTVQNNIFMNMDGEHLKGTITAGNNLIWRSDGGRIYAPTYSSDKIAVNPLLDASSFCPLPNSPVIALGWGARPVLCGVALPTATISPIPATVIRTPSATSTLEISTGSPSAVSTSIFDETATDTPSPTNTPSFTPSLTRTASPTRTPTPTPTRFLTVNGTRFPCPCVIQVP